MFEQSEIAQSIVANQPSDVEWVPLRRLIQEDTVPMADLLQIAVNLARTVLRIHASGVVHHGIQSDRIFITSGLQVALAQVGESPTKYADVAVSVFPGSRVPDRIAYMAPEQLGRTASTVDFRTDIYSLGVVLYEVATCHLPYEEDDAIALSHAVLAKLARPPVDWRPTLPAVVSELIMKCIAKEPEQRYQSIYGLWNDLKTCQAQWVNHATVEPFVLGIRDVVQLSTGLLGMVARTAEQDYLHSVLARVRQDGNELVFVSGESGIGKTALVENFLSALPQDSTLIATSKCDLNRSGVPYGAVASGLRGLLRQLLAQSYTEHTEWVYRLHVEVGEESHLLRSIIPELGYFLTSLTGHRNSRLNLMTSDASHLDSSRLAMLGDSDMITMRSQVMQAFRSLIQTLAREKTLVIYIDDLQWADPTTLQLLHLLVTDSDLTHVMWVFSTRSDAEKSFQDWLHMVVSKRPQEQTSTILLQGLADDEILAYLKMVLSESIHHLVPLAQFVKQQTGGNPLYIQQILRMMHDEGDLKFDVEVGQWHWNLDAHRKTFLTSHLIGERVQNVGQLSSVDLHVLQWGACFGHRFEVDCLCNLSGLSKAEVHHAVEVGLRMGLLSEPNLTFDHASMEVRHPEPSDPHEQTVYRFAHDQIQQVCLATLSELEFQRMHCQIGDYLAGQLDETKHSETIYGVTNHLNLGRESYGNPLKLVEFNTLAGQVAQASAAFETALDYYSTGLKLLGKWDGKKRPELAFELSLGQAQCLLVMGQLSESEQSLLQILQAPLELTQKMKVYRILIRVYSHGLRNEEAFDLTSKAMRELGLRLRNRVTKFDLVFHTFAMFHKLKGRSPDYLKNRPEIADERIRMLLEIMAWAAPSVFYLDQKLMIQLFLEILKLTVKHGNAAVSAVAYSNYGMLLCAGFHHYQDGTKYGRIGIELADSYPDAAVVANARFVFATFISPWTQPLRQSEQHLMISQESGMNSGDVFAASTSALFLTIIKFYVGKPLSEVTTSIQENLLLAARFQHALATDYLRFIETVVNRLRGERDEEVPAYTIVDPIYTVVYGTTHLLELVISENYATAQIVSEQIEKAATKQSIDFFLLPDALTLQAILLARRFPTVGPKEQRQIRRKLVRIEKRLAHWARHAPANYLHKQILVQAECSRIFGRRLEAESAYEKAIAEAGNYGFVQYSAIANEQAGRYYHHLGQVNVARAFLVAAMDDYQKWGARKKVHMLEEEFSGVLRRGHGERRRIDRLSLSQIGSLPMQVNQNIDLLTVVRGAQAISREVVLENLLQQLMLMVLEHAGAQRGVLFLQRDGQLFMEASESVGQPGSFLQSVPFLETKEHVPISMVDFTFRTKQDVVLGDAARAGDFVRDPYVVANKLKSVACTPIMSRQTVIGVLYLENNHIARAFTQERLQVLKLLAAQAAISIENAYLYSGLEQMVAERTRELQMSKRTLEQMNETLAVTNETLAVTNARLEQKNEELRQSEAIRRDLIANISHDLRTPITLILGYSEAVLHDVAKDGTQVKTFLERIHIKAAGLTRLIEDLFHLARLESRQAELNFELCNAQDLVLDVVRKYQMDVQHAGLDFVWRVVSSDNLVDDTTLSAGQGLNDSWLRVDTDRLNQVFGNLIYNAIKHTPKKGTISLIATRNDDEVRFQIKDTGLGIGLEDLPYVFERFYKADKSRNPTSGGSGLGLAIAKEIVELHGGEISVQSIPGTGSTFTFGLPVVQFEMET